MNNFFTNNNKTDKLREEIWRCHVHAEQRCLRKACEWAEDMALALPETNEEKIMLEINHKIESSFPFDAQYEHAKACFELQEYDRAAHILRDPGMDDRRRFLQYFSMYKAAEKKRIDLMNEVSVNIPKKAMLKFNELRDSLERSMAKQQADGYLLYVYGLVLHKFRVKKKSIEVLAEAIERNPSNWSAWFMLATIIDDEKQLHDLQLPNHLFKVFFYYMISLELDLRNLSFANIDYKELEAYVKKHFKNSFFIKTLIAKSLSHTGERNMAINIFIKFQDDDPYRVDAMDIYSNALYVEKEKRLLARLAFVLGRVDSISAEANCCIANSYSAREQHTKAIVYFTRALRINPDHVNAWTLIGHEYLEVKSIDKALQAYRNAIFINKRDHRAWLGLGNTFETIMTNVQNPNYEPCLYYYSQVAKYKPNDQNMFLGMGSIYEKIGEFKEAILCMKRAGKEGESRLEKLYDKIGGRENDETQNTDN